MYSLESTRMTVRCCLSDLRVKFARAMKGKTDCLLTELTAQPQSLWCGIGRHVILLTLLQSGLVSNKVYVLSNIKTDIHFCVCPCLHVYGFLKSVYCILF